MACKPCEERRKLLKDAYEKTKEILKPKKGEGGIKVAEKKNEGQGV